MKYILLFFPYYLPMAVWACLGNRRNLKQIWCAFWHFHDDRKMVDDRKWRCERCGWWGVIPYN